MSSVGAVVGAMTGDEASFLRNRMPGAWFLVPGIGAQGGATQDAIAGIREDKLGCLVNSSRAVLYPKMRLKMHMMKSQLAMDFGIGQNPCRTLSIDV